MNKSNLIKKVVSVSGIIIIAKILGFIKQVLTASYFGASIQTDLIYLSEGLVSNIDYLLVQALSTAFIPTYVAINPDVSESKKKFVAHTISFFLVITLIISGILFFAAPIVSRILAPSYNSDLSLQLANYIRLFAPTIIFIVELAVFSSLLKANEKFIPGELVSCNQSIIMIILVLTIGSSFGPDTLVVGFYAYAIFNLLFLAAVSRDYCSVGFSDTFSDPDVKRMLIMMGPLILGYSMVFVNQQVDKIIVSGLGSGIVTAMSYAAVLSNFVGTFIGSICGVMFTYVSQNIAENKEQDAAELITSTSILLITLFLPISALTIANSTDIVTIVFRRGQFNEVAVIQCAVALAGYGFMFVSLVLREQFSRFQYAYGDSRGPMINSTIAIVFNIIFSILLSRWFGVLGVTLATSLSVLICAILNIRSSFLRNKYLHLSAFSRYLPNWLIGVLVCLGTSFLGQKYLISMGPLVRFLGVIILSLALYGIVVWRIVQPVTIYIKDRS